ncbi:MAG: hypothetical protein GOP50_05645 [Candidatus Heimdallarchaeota archaeon]|nr:hypothetical protein [Candidatus Heimdallarchaeota archaeon]
MTKTVYQNKIIVLLLFVTLSSSFMLSPIEAQTNSVKVEDLSINYVVSPAIAIYQNSHFALNGFAGNGTESNPYIIENLKINTDTNYGIYVEGTNSHFIIRNCLVDAYMIGINIYDCAPGTATIYNNTCKSIKGGTGIQTLYSPNITVSDNICENNYGGIIVDLCENATISNNHCGFNDMPIGVFYSKNSYVFNNTCDYSSNVGVYVVGSNGTTIANNTIDDIGGSNWGGNRAIDLSYSSNITIKHNLISDCGVGIELFAIQESESFGNIIMRCDSYGFYVDWYSTDWPSANNTFHHNFLVGNAWSYSYWSNPTSQALDRGQNSVWYDVNTNVGNYWSNYTGSGVYDIDGGKFYYDPYPFAIIDTDSDGLDDMQENFIYFTNPYLNDTDSDLLLDSEEIFVYGTDPNRIDTDYDGLLDGEEVFIYDTGPTTQDTDTDELKDGEEIFVFGTNPKRRDTDGDTMPDGWEVINGLDPLVENADEDPDLDGLINLEELSEDTEPLNNDTDEDFLIDGEEVHTFFSSPLNNDTDADGALDGVEVHDYGCNPTIKDTDGDNLSDGKEIYQYFTSPTDKDSDGDGCDDGWEVKYKLDPLDASDADLDPDDDGLINSDEFVYGTHPNYWDTDEDDFSDGLEVRKGTNPLLITDHPMAREDVINMGVGISIASAAVIGLTFYILIKKRIIRFKK